MSGENPSSDEGPQKPLRTVVWVRPVTWEQCFDGEGMLNKDAMVEKKADNEKLLELIRAQGWVKHESPVAERLGMPMTVWAAPSPPTDEAKEAEAAAEGSDKPNAPTKPNAPATVLLASTATGKPEAQVSEMAVVVHSDPEKSLTPQMLRNILLFIHEMRESGILHEGQVGGGEATEPAALSAAIKSWSGFVRQLTYHLRSGLMLEDAGSGPAMPKLLPDGTLKQE